MKVPTRRQKLFFRRTRDASPGPGHQSAALEFAEREQRGKGRTRLEGRAPAARKTESQRVEAPYPRCCAACLLVGRDGEGKLLLGAKVALFWKRWQK